MKHAKRRGGRLATIAVVGSFLLGTASPSLAADTAAPLTDPKPTLAAAASVKVEALTAAALAAVAVQDASPAQSAEGGGFFKSGKGKATLVLMLAATGFVVYSKYNDRVKSVIRN